MCYPSPQFPEHLEEVKATLRTLDVSTNQLTQVPPVIGEFRVLKSLNLSHNKIGGWVGGYFNCLVLAAMYVCMTGKRYTSIVQLLLGSTWFDIYKTKLIS